MGCSSGRHLASQGLPPEDAVKRMRGNVRHELDECGTEAVAVGDMEGEVHVSGGVVRGLGGNDLAAWDLELQ